MYFCTSFRSLVRPFVRLPVAVSHLRFALSFVIAHDVELAVAEVCMTCSRIYTQQKKKRNLEVFNFLSLLWFLEIRHMMYVNIESLNVKVICTCFQSTDIDKSFVCYILYAFVRV